MQQPTVAWVVEFYPQIACPELPAEVFDYLKEKKIEHMSYGGTWERYYIWGVSIPAGDGKEAESMLNDVVVIIDKLGYSLWKEEGGVKTYQKKGTGGETSSFMDLEIEENNLFRLRFQPRS